MSRTHLSKVISSHIHEQWTSLPAGGSWARDAMSNGGRSTVGSSSSRTASVKTAWWRKGCPLDFWVRCEGGLRASGESSAGKLALWKTPAGWKIFFNEDSFWLEMYMRLYVCKCLTKQFTIGSHSQLLFSHVRDQSATKQSSASLWRWHWSCSIGIPGIVPILWRPEDQGMNQT